MAWTDIRGYSPETLEMQWAMSVISTELTSLYGNTKATPLQLVGINKMLKALRNNNSISPKSVVLILLKYPELFAKISLKKNKEVRKSILRLAETQDVQESMLVTLLYDNYNTHGSLFKAMLKVRRYPFTKFSRKFVHDVFEKYQFLKKPEHLTHVVEVLKTVGYAYRLTKSGIKEYYDAKCQ